MFVFRAKRKTQGKEIREKKDSQVLAKEKSKLKKKKHDNVNNNKAQRAEKEVKATKTPTLVTVSQKETAVTSVLAHSEDESNVKTSIRNATSNNNDKLTSDNNNDTLASNNKLKIDETASKEQVLENNKSKNNILLQPCENTFHDEINNEKKNDSDSNSGSGTNLVVRDNSNIKMNGYFTNGFSFHNGYFDPEIS